MENLKQLLSAIHRKSYPAYKSLRGTYHFKTYKLSIDHVQGDSFASPSNVSVQIPLQAAGFPASYYDCYEKRIALQKISLHGNFIISCLNIISNQKVPEKADYFQRVTLNRKFSNEQHAKLHRQRLLHDLK